MYGNVSVKMPTLVVPGVALGPFRLGIRLPEALRILDTEAEYERIMGTAGRDAPTVVQGPGDPSGVTHSRRQGFTKNRLLIHEGNSLKYDLVLDCPSYGVQLRFDPLSQRLWVIDCYDISKTALAYRSPGSHGASPAKVFSGESKLPSFAHIFKLFGPTFPSEFDNRLEAYPLEYRGVTFFFSLPEPFRRLYTPQTAKMPLKLPDGSELSAQRVVVHAGPIRAPKLPPELCVNDVHASLAFQLNEDKTRCTNFALRMDLSGRIVRMNDPVQHVLSELGSPSNVYQKTSDQMQIHKNQRVSGSARILGQDCTNKRIPTVTPRHVASDNMSVVSMDVDSTSNVRRGKHPSYFYNYYHLGIDILFDGTRHTVKKIVCHSNFPGHADFGVYQRCHFRLMARNNSAVVASLQSNWDSARPVIEQHIGKTSGPMVCARRNSDMDEVYSFAGQAVAACPYSPSLLYAIPGVIFEVLERSGHIATVTLFSE